ncbi:hypothetical protein [Brevibacillus laterosporus]|uniref:hypothetical protein n=1 Tax=Brevibacillus laterosporus TaxID=1465 RepID=UPI001F1ECC80|nr:hypothetical protein [Brevibacillus laterosporus]
MDTTLVETHLPVTTGLLEPPCVSTVVRVQSFISETADVPPLLFQSNTPNCGEVSPALIAPIFQPPLAAKSSVLSCEYQLINGSAIYVNFH